MDEANCVGDEDFLAGLVLTVFAGGGGDVQFTDARVEGGEEFISGVSAFIGEGVEQCAFAGVGVADKGGGF